MIKQHTVVISRRTAPDSEAHAIQQISLDAASAMQLDLLNDLLEQGMQVIHSSVVYLDDYIFVLYHLYLPDTQAGRARARRLKGHD